MWEMRLIQITNSKRTYFCFKRVYLNWENKIQCIDPDIIKMEGKDLKEISSVHAQMDLAFKKQVIKYNENTGVVTIGGINVGYADGQGKNRSNIHLTAIEA